MLVAVDVNDDRRSLHRLMSFATHWEYRIMAHLCFSQCIRIFGSEVSLLESNIQIPLSVSCELLCFEWIRVTGAAQSRNVCLLVTAW